MKPEERVKRGVAALLKKHEVWYYKPQMGGLGTAGIPDFMCCIRGRMLGIETKAMGKKPTPIQQLRIDEINKAGGVAVVVREDSLESLERLFLIMLLSPNLGVKNERGAHSVDAAQRMPSTDSDKGNPEAVA